MQIQLCDAVWICPEWCCIKGLEEGRAGNLIKGECHYSKWEMASAENVASKLKWLLHSPTVFVTDTGGALLFPIIFYGLFFFFTPDVEWDNDCQGRINATTLPEHTHIDSYIHTHIRTLIHTHTKGFLKHAARQYSALLCPFSWTKMEY